ADRISGKRFPNCLKVKTSISEATSNVSRKMPWWSLGKMRYKRTQKNKGAPSMLHLLDHPLATHVVTHLRDSTSKPATFRTLAYQISLLLALEVTRDLGMREVEVQT